MDDFREWISDNLRYILLGLAAILVIVVAFLIFRLVSGNSAGGGDTNAQQTESSTNQPAVVVDSENTTDVADNTREDLVKNDPDVLALVERYYQAVGDDDLATLQQIVDSSDKAQDIINRNNQNSIEGIQDITVYSKSGPTTGTYVVYAYYNGKLSGFDTLVPSLSSMYLVTEADGSLIVADPDSDESVANYIKQVHADADVQRLRQDVDDKLKIAQEADPALKTRLEQLSLPETESVLPNSDDVDVEVNKQVVATDVCNVRADSVETADILGMLAVGEKVTRIRELDNGWSEIRYGERTAYVSSAYLTEDTTSVQDQSESQQQQSQ